MPLDSDFLNKFMTWISTFDTYVLQNEADVEVKFVYPFFRLLGYSDAYCREKYPLKLYNPGKQGRKPEIDIIYFSTEKHENQGQDTSLLLVEAKEPSKVDLEEDVAQAIFYSNYLKPLFYVVTNSHRLMIFKRHRHHEDECVFNVPTSELHRVEIVKRLYQLLHFDIVWHLKEQAVNDLTHTLYIDLTNVLSQKPDLLEQIAKGNFISSVEFNGRHLTVSKPSVAIDCTLPAVFKGGSCRIEFSNYGGRTCQDSF